MSLVLQRQPWKTLFVAFEVLATILVRLPLWLLYYIPKSNRIRPWWSYRRSIVLKLMQRLNRQLLFDAALIQPSNPHLPLDTGRGKGGVWVPAAPQLVTGEIKEWADEVGVESASISAYWLMQKGSNTKPGDPPLPGEKVVFYLHGGAFMLTTAHPNDLPAGIVRSILDLASSPCRALLIEYRLSHGPPAPANPFPAALLDTISGYRYLVEDAGFAPENIIILGDSSGATLGLALTRYLLENQDHPALAQLALPGRSIYCYPWADVGDSTFEPNLSPFTHIDIDGVDIMRPSFQRAVHAFLGPKGMAAGRSSRWLSPASTHPSRESAPFSGFPKTLIIGGEADVMFEHARRLKDLMKADIGESLTWYAQKDAMHNFLLYPWLEPERSEALDKIAKWLASE